MSDWYNITVQDLLDLGGGGLVMKHGQSPSKLLSEAFPEYDWLPWKFHQCPYHIWTDIKNQEKFMEWAKNELNIQEMEDWYQVTNQV